MLENRKNITNLITIQKQEIHIWKVSRTENLTRNSDSLTTVQSIANRYYPTYQPPTASTYNLYRSPRQKPFFYNTLLKFSLAHTRNILMIAYTLHQNLGLDLESSERKIPTAHLLSLAKRFFHPDELLALYQAAPDPQPPLTSAPPVSPYDQEDLIHLFFKLWTQKEAYAKALDLPLFTTLKLSQPTMEKQANFLSPSFPKPASPPLESPLILNLAIQKPKKTNHSPHTPYKVRFFKF